MPNPFKKVEDFENEINDFLRRNKTFISNQGSRISDYFEMSCYNYIVRYYQNHGFELKVKNLIARKFKYKLSPNGYPENFSFFEISCPVDNENFQMKICFEIHHNLTVQSGFQDDIYLTPDISVINKDSIISENDHYLVKNSTKKFCYVANKDLQTFCEVKNFTPFPELLFNFIGLFNELKSHSLSKEWHIEAPKHLSPSLMISGKGNIHTDKIKHSLEKRYGVNLFFDLFENGLINFTAYNSVNINKIGSLNPKIFSSLTTDAVIDEIDLPF